MLPEKYCFDLDKSGFFRQFHQNQPVVNYFYFSSVHITLGFQSEVSTFIIKSLELRLIVLKSSFYIIKYSENVAESLEIVKNDFSHNFLVLINM
jgi:hypothetical protein